MQFEGLSAYSSVVDSVTVRRQERRDLALHRRKELRELRDTR